MAIRKSKQEMFLINGNVEDWLTKSEIALKEGGFTNIKINRLLNQITADYKKISIWGEISISLITEVENIRINVISTANTDNIFALFISPNQKILTQFKNNLTSHNTVP